VHPNESVPPPLKKSPRWFHAKLCCDYVIVYTVSSFSELYQLTFAVVSHKMILVRLHRLLCPRVTPLSALLLVRPTPLIITVVTNCYIHELIIQRETSHVRTTLRLLFVPTVSTIVVSVTKPRFTDAATTWRSTFTSYIATRTVAVI